MNDILGRLQERFSPGALFGRFMTELLPDIVVAALTFAGFYLLWRVLLRATLAFGQRARTDATLLSFVQLGIKYVIITIGAIAALSELGIDTSSVLTSLGIAGLTLGFAARDALSNMISGIFIFWDRPFVIGDLIEVGGHYGRVDSITMRSTRVVTVDGRMLAVPNSEIINSTVASYTNFPHLRLDVDITVGVEEDLGRVRQLLLGVVAGDKRFLTDRPAEVVVTALNDYNVAVQLRAWLDDEKSHTPVRFELREKMFEALRGAGVDMPFETFAVAPVNVVADVAPPTGRPKPAGD